MERHQVAIVIPALNEASTIRAVVAGVSPHGIVVVVDDGSSDETGAHAREAGAIVVRMHNNSGYDQALNAGFNCAAGLKCEYIITMDADGQHDPTILATFLTRLEAGADVVLGVRDRRQRFAEQLFALITFVRWRIRDPLCGMKGYRASVYRELGHFDSYGSVGTELTLFAARRGKRLAQVPFMTRDRLGTPRFGRLLSANARILRAMLLGML